MDSPTLAAWGREWLARLKVLETQGILREQTLLVYEAVVRLHFGALAAGRADSSDGAKYLLTGAMCGSNLHLMTPSDFITAIRARGLNQKEAAAALGVTEGAVSRWVNGNRPIPDIAVVALKAIPLKRKKPAA